jgi:hypothetical protein
MQSAIITRCVEEFAAQDISSISTVGVNQCGLVNSSSSGPLAIFCYVIAVKATLRRMAVKIVFLDLT